MRFHDSLVGLFFLVLGAFVLWQAASFPIMPGQIIGPATFPSIFGYVFILGGLGLIFSGLRGRARRLLTLNPGWLQPSRALAAVFALVGTLALAIFFEEIGFLIGVSVLTAGLYFMLGYRSPWWLALSVGFTGVVYYGIAKVLTVPLPLGPLS